MSDRASRNAGLTDVASPLREAARSIHTPHMGVWDERHVAILDWANRINALRSRSTIQQIAEDPVPRGIETRGSSSPPGARSRRRSKSSRQPEPGWAPEWMTAFGRLYSAERLKRFARIHSGDPAGIEEALVFLEADPWCFRSGYVKQDLLRALRRVTLDATQQDRLRDVVMNAVKAGPRMEFRDYCRTARTVDSDQLRAALTALTAPFASGDGAATRAHWMLEALDRPARP